MKHDHKRGERMIDRKQIRFLMEEDDKVIAELLYHSFKYMNEKKFSKTTEPRVNQKSANKLISQRYQNVSRKQRINKSALYCGKVKY